MFTKKFLRQPEHCWNKPICKLKIYVLFSRSSNLQKIPPNMSMCRVECLPFTYFILGCNNFFNVQALSNKNRGWLPFPTFSPSQFPSGKKSKSQLVSSCWKLQNATIFLVNAIVVLRKNTLWCVLLLRNVALKCFVQNDNNPGNVLCRMITIQKMFCAEW